MRCDDGSVVEPYRQVDRSNTMRRRGRVLAIRCCGLTKRYGGRAVVDGLDLEVEQGELFGFLGPNGSGKTTTTRLLLGLIKADGGEAWLLGSRVPCPERLPEIGAMVEEPAFYPWLSGRRNLEIVGDEGGAVSAGWVDDALELAGIAHAADTKVKTYSQGMRQRLGLAAAVLRRPALVLLDEPANGLDPAGIQARRHLLRHLAAAGSTVFLSSHLLGEVEQVCQRVAVIDRGRLLSVLSVDDLDRAAERIRVTVDSEDMAAARTALDKWTTVTDAPGQLVVAGRAGRDVNRALAEAGIFASAIVAERLSLEERFLAITETEGDRDAAAAS
jgi:ABC-type multidrug transport system ATPase subunit